MKKRLLTLAALTFAILPSFAQKFELSVQANSGLFHFSGNSAVSTSQVLQGSTTGDQMNHTNNPYGNHNGFSYGGNIQGQIVARSGFILGLHAGYELLRSQVNINQYTPIVYYLNYDIISTDPSFAVKGHTHLQNQAINLNPYIGYRLQLKRVKLDILPGMDIGFILKTKDKGSVKDAGGKDYTVDYARPKAPTDIRLRLGVAAHLYKFGLNASYAHGISNYLSGTVGITNQGQSTSESFSAHSELFRLGLSYQLN